MRTKRLSLTFLTSIAVVAMLAAAAAPTAAADEDLKLGVSISTTGQGAALGIPERNTLSLYPKEIGGAKLEIIQLDDAGDPTIATTNARRLATDDKVDVLIGSSTTPPSIAMGNVANEVGVPHFALAPMPITPDLQEIMVELASMTSSPSLITSAWSSERASRITPSLNTTRLPR